MTAVSRLVVIAMAFVFALPVDAVAAEVVREDTKGRLIRFDVRVSGAPVDWAAGLLRSAAHGDEISDVTIRLASTGEVASTCGRAAAGCYRATRGGRVVVAPAGRSARVAHTLIHEYGHHVDWSLSNGGVPEPNGARLWWRARGMGKLHAVRTVAFGYELGWDRAIGEIFAEDYARINRVGSFRIPWLRPPDGVIRRAILADLGLAAPPMSLSRNPQVRPFLLEQEGTLEAGERTSLAFGLLGPGRRAVVSAQVGGTVLDARLEVVCGSRVATQAIDAASGDATLTIPNLGPGRCRASLVNTSSEATRFTLRLRVFLPI